VIGIAMGSTIGFFMLTAMLVTLIAITLHLMLKKHKKASFNFSANVAYSKRKVYNSAIVTEQNSVYASSSSLSIGNNLKGVESDVEYESFHDSTRTEFYSEAKRASIVDSFTQVPDNNISYYEPSLFSNIAYGSSSNRC
jgi:cbb3-type cytochrome oxidase subunit 3